MGVFTGGLNPFLLDWTYLNSIWVLLHAIAVFIDLLAFAKLGFYINLILTVSHMYVYIYVTGTKRCLTTIAYVLILMVGFGALTYHLVDICVMLYRHSCLLIICWQLYCILHIYMAMFGALSRYDNLNNIICFLSLRISQCFFIFSFLFWRYLWSRGCFYCFLCILVPTWMHTCVSLYAFMHVCTHTISLFL